MKTAFDRFYNEGRKPADAMNLAIQDAIHAKLETYPALKAFRDEHEALRQTVNSLILRAEQVAQHSVEPSPLREAILSLKYYAQESRKVLNDIPSATTS